MGYLSEDEDDGPREERYCDSYLVHGVCHRRARNQYCRFVHDAMIFKSSYEIMARCKKLCADYINQGWCRAGERCRDIHRPQLRELKIRNQEKAAAAAIEAKEEVKRIIADIEKNFHLLQAHALIPLNVQLEQRKEMLRINDEKKKEADEKARVQWAIERAEAAKRPIDYDAFFALPDIVSPSEYPEQMREAVAAEQRAENERAAAAWGKYPSVWGDGAATEQPLAQAPRKLCTHFIKGYCKFGRRCLKLHDEELRKQELDRLNAKKATANSEAYHKSEIAAKAKTDSTASKDQPEAKKPKNKKAPRYKNKAKSSSKAVVAPDTADNVQVTDPVPTDGNADEVQKDNYFIAETKHIDEHFPALPQKSKKAPFADMTPAWTQGNALSTVSLGKNLNHYKAKATPWTSNTRASTNRHNSLVPSEFPAMPVRKKSTGESREKTPSTSSWSQPLAIPREHLADPNPPKKTCKLTDLWSPEQLERVSWARSNLSSRQREKYLAEYLAPKEQTKPSQALEQIPSAMNMSNLPREIQDQIWRLVLNDPDGQMLRLGFYPTNRDENIGFFRARSRVPALLHVNRRARYWAQKHYELAFGTSEHPAETYINFETDKVMLHARCGAVQELMHAINPVDKVRIQTVIVALTDWTNTPDKIALCKDISRFSTCKELYLMAGEGKYEKRWTKSKSFPDRLRAILEKEWSKTHKKNFKEYSPPSFAFWQVDVDTARIWQLDNLLW